MRGKPSLFFLGVPLAFLLLLTACPAAGPGFGFPGAYSAAIPGGTYDITLIQTGSTVTGTLTKTPPPGTAAITATVIAQGEATGIFTPIAPPGAGQPCTLYLTQGGTW